MCRSDTVINESVRLVRRESRSLSSLSVVYSFYELSINAHRYYAVCVESEESSAFESLGEEYISAKESYMAIRDGLVSPLGLFDVVSDIKNAQKY